MSSLDEQKKRIMSMDPKSKILLWTLIILAAAILGIWQIAPKSGEEKIIKEIGKSMASQEKFIKTVEKYYNYKAYYAYKIVVENDESFGRAEYKPSDPLSKEKAELKLKSNAIKKEYLHVTKEEENEVKEELLNSARTFEIPKKKLNVAEIGESHEYEYIPCFNERIVTFVDENKLLYRYAFVFYEQKLVTIYSYTDYVTNY